MLRDGRGGRGVRRMPSPDQRGDMSTPGIPATDLPVPLLRGEGAQPRLDAGLEVPGSRSPGSPDGPVAPEKDEDGDRTGFAGQVTVREFRKSLPRDDADLGGSAGLQQARREGEGDEKGQ
jgi:hypothetical protein